MRACQDDVGVPDRRGVVGSCVACVAERVGA